MSDHARSASGSPVHHSASRGVDDPYERSRYLSECCSGLFAGLALMAFVGLMTALRGFETLVYWFFWSSPAEAPALFGVRGFVCWCLILAGIFCAPLGPRGFLKGFVAAVVVFGLASQIIWFFGVAIWQTLGEIPPFL